MKLSYLPKKKVIFMFFYTSQISYETSRTGDYHIYVFLQL